MVAAAPAEGSRRIPELDGIRGLAILLVLAWHYIACQQAFAGAGATLNKLLVLSWSGVDLFFVLSGFLIGGILIDQRGAPNYFRAFYARRLFRIVPLYALWIVLFLALRSLAMPWLFDGGMPLWSYATFTQNLAMAHFGSFGANWLAMTWSLAIEEQFYLVLPLLVAVVPPRRLPAVLAVLIAAAPASRLALLAAQPQDTLRTFVLPFCRADALLLGVFCAWAWRTHGDALRRAHSELFALFIAGAVALAAMAWNHEGFGTRGMNAYGLTLIAIVYAALLLLVLTARGGLLAALARWRPLRALGVIAYATYILHQGVSGLTYALLRGHPPRMLATNDIAITALAFGITIVAATISWHAFEKPLLAIGHRVRYDAAHTTHAAVAE